MRVRVLAEAEAELLEATLFYERRQAGLGWDFHSRVEAAISAIQGSPHRFPAYEGALLEQRFRCSLPFAPGGLQPAVRRKKGNRSKQRKAEDIKERFSRSSLLSYEL